VLIFGGWADLVGCAGSQGMPEAREPSLPENHNKLDKIEEDDESTML